MSDKFEVNKFLGWIAQWQIELKKIGKCYQLTEREIDMAEEGWIACKSEIVKWIQDKAGSKQGIHVKNLAFALFDLSVEIDKKFQP